MKKEPKVIKEKIRSFIFRTAHIEQIKIKDYSLIFREGFLDSMGFIALVTFLDEEFTVKPNDSDLIEENFESIDAISNFVVRKLE
jgi:acyl carrier protein